MPRSARPEHADLALDDVERLVFLVVDVHGRGCAASVGELDLRQAAVGVVAGGFDGYVAAEPPDGGTAAWAATA